MSLFLRASNIGLLLGCTAVMALSSEVSEEELSELQIDRALEAIWVKSANAKQSSPGSAKRAALGSYIASLGPGTAIITRREGVQEKETPFPPAQFHAEVIAPCRRVHPDWCI
jgi:hypothetical protein